MKNKIINIIKEFNNDRKQIFIQKILELNISFSIFSELKFNSSIEMSHGSFSPNIKAKIKATDNNKKPLLLSAHMDVVGDDSPINLKLNGDIIETDKTRTLGADDKAGVAAAILLALELTNNKELSHGGLEIIFTRDEEQTMSGIHHVKMNEIEAEHILVLDADELGQVQIAGASYSNLTINVKGLKGEVKVNSLDRPLEF